MFGLRAAAIRQRRAQRVCRRTRAQALLRRQPCGLCAGRRLTGRFLRLFLFNRGGRFQGLRCGLIGRLDNRLARPRRGCRFAFFSGSFGFPLLDEDAKMPADCVGNILVD
jgi:hypothetical protein